MAYARVCLVCQTTFRKARSHEGRCRFYVKQAELRQLGLVRLAFGTPIYRKLGVEIRREAVFPSNKPERTFRSFVPAWSERVVNALFEKFDHPRCRSKERRAEVRSLVKEGKMNELALRNPALGFHKAASKVAEMLKGLNEEDALCFIARLKVGGDVHTSLDKLELAPRERPVASKST